MRHFPSCCTIPPSEALTIATAETISTPASNTGAAANLTRPARMVSLDVFRGATIAAMILVNDPGSWSHIYPPLEHAEWNGWTPTDLIFPFFLFIVGVSLTLSLASRIARGLTRGALALHVVRRSALIFAIGLFLNGFPEFDFSSIRIMGVLQRIALCYLVAGLLYLATFQSEPTSDGPARVRANLRVTAAVAVVLLVGYWALMMFVPVPGYGAGHLGKDDNLGAYIDRALMSGHLWGESVTWDPEGLLSTLPAIASLLIGILAGEWLRSDRRAGLKALGLAAAGLVLVVAGRLIHPYFPINKNLWTSSFVLFTAGFAMLALAGCYWIVDVRAWRAWTSPFLVFGMNAILGYALAALVSEVSTDFEFSGSHGHETTLHGWLYGRFFVPHANPVNASLAFAVFFVLVIFALLWPFYRGKVFLRV
ncbi:MAG TPA: heparan-alpha-glucosaminide N-acetyltransferase domain-containing protein [Candidatus Acidoferrales bacterium]|nr:heparan-alpha-glucosaminide N-acetyltransferase domain-containing protein [Candidatus Acidoferrales bacterium]